MNLRATKFCVTVFSVCLDFCFPNDVFFLLVYFSALPRDISLVENAFILKRKAKGTKIVMLMIPSDV